VSEYKAVAVIAHYSKSRQEVDELKYQLSRQYILPLVFSKAEAQQDKSDFMLKNVGRESETFFTYILNKLDPDGVLNNWNEDYTIFLQDDATRHCPDLFKIIESALKEDKKGFTGLGVMLDGIDGLAPRLASRFHGYPGTPSTKDLFQKYFLKPFPEENYWFIAGAQFMVHKSMYMNRNVDRIKMYLEDLRAHQHPFSALAWERFWPWYLNEETQ
jgi:hypothetical protein